MGLSLNAKNIQIIEKEAFNFGYDMYCAKLRIENCHIRSDDLKVNAKKGYSFAKLKHVNRKKSDPVVKKWLSIRARCLGFRECSLTLEEVGHLFDQVGQLCPITSETLMSGQKDGSDWSIDRIDSSKGYTFDNVIVMSAAANQAKADLDPEGIVRVATSKKLMSQAPHNKISETSWHRMCSGFNNLVEAYVDVPFCQMIEDDNQQLSATNLVMGIGRYAEKHHHVRPLFKELEKDIGKAKVDAMVKCIRQRHKKILLRHRDHSAMAKCVLESDKIKKILNFVFDVMKKDKKYDKLFMSAFYSFLMTDGHLFRNDPAKDFDKKRDNLSCSEPSV